MRKLNSLFSLAVLLSLFFCWGPTATAQRGPKVMPSQGYQLPAQKGIRTVQDLRDPIPAGMARIILEAHNVWNDGTGYQMLWDADHNEYGASIPTLESNSWIFASGSIPAGLFDPFEYKVPANADASFTPTNFVLDGTATVDIPAGTYDYVIINPNPGILYIVGQGVARADDYAVEAGKTYHFTISKSGTGDNAEVVVTGGGDTPNLNPVQNLTGSADGNKVTLKWTAPNAKRRSMDGRRELILVSVTDAPELLRSNESEIVLEAHDVWNDGSGYQIVLDADHTAFGQEIPAVGSFTNNCDVPADFFAPFEYTVPENADPSCSPTNMVVDGTATVKIPAGVYDYAIAAPQAGVRIWIAGGDKSRADDYNFEAGKKYHFLMQIVGTGDGSELTISGGGSTADYTYTVYRDGAMIKDGLTATTFSEENVAAGTHNYCVEVKYTAGVSPKECVDVTVPGGVLNPVTNLTAEKNGDDVVLKWIAPNGTTPNPNPGETALEEGFESGIPATWKTIDADGDGNNWTDQMSAIFSGHTGLCVSSASYINNVGPQTPDNYLVTPELNLPNGGKLTFWVCGQDADYAAEHYAVYASSTGNEAVNFSNALLEETLTAKSVVTAPEAIRGTRAQGTWYEKTVQLPAGTKYVAFRHFDVTDQFWLNLDDVKIAATTKRADLLSEGFESGIPATWKTIDADGDGHDWTTTPPPGFNAFPGHESTTAVSSASFINGGIGALTPDNYLVTPELNLANGGTLTFWVCAQDAAYAAEHYAVYASSTGNEAANFTNALLEETLTAKTVVTAPEAIRGARAQGTWYQKTVQLPAGTKYVAFRHFDCTDMFWLNLDDVKITGEGGSSADYTYTVYRDGTKIKDGLTATTYTDAGQASSNHEYCVEVKYAAGVSPKVCVNYTDLNDVVAAKPYTITVVGKTITVTCEGTAMIYDMTGRRLASGRNTVVYTAQGGFYAAMIVVDGKSYVEKLAIK